MSNKLVKYEAFEKLREQRKTVYTSKNHLRIKVILQTGLDKEIIFVWGVQGNEAFAYFIKIYNNGGLKVDIYNIIGQHIADYTTVEDGYIIIDTWFELYSRINIDCHSYFELYQF